MNFSALVLVKTSIFKILQSGKNPCASLRLQKRLKTSNRRQMGRDHPVATRLAAVEQEPEVVPKIYQRLSSQSDHKSRL